MGEANLVQSTDAISDVKLPFPNRGRELAESGSYDVEYLDVKRMKNTELEAKCKLYGLKPYSGKRKEILVAMLMEFSALGNDGWKEHFTPGARLAHLGPRIGTKALNKVQQRRQDVLGINEDDRDLALTGKRPVRSKDTRSEEEIKAPLAWAARVLAHHEATKVPLSDLQHSHFPLPSEPLSEAVKSPPEPLLADTTLLREITALRCQLAILPHTLSSVPGPIYDSYETDHWMSDATVCQPSLPPLELKEPGGPSMVSECFISPCEDVQMDISMPVDCNDAPRVFELNINPTPLCSQQADIPSVSPRMADEVRVLELGGGRQPLVFTDKDVPPAPLYRNRTIDTMASMWDDNNTHLWNPPEDALRIKGVPIPIRLWPRIYSQGRGELKTQWKRYKSQWSVWQFVLVAYVNSKTADDFWARFTSDNGTRLSFTQISKVLRQQRSRDDARYAELARQTPDFQDLYSYKRKGRGPTPMSRDWVIAKAYRKRHGIEDMYEDAEEDTNN